MADYHNLLSRAVSGLPNPTPDARKAIYDRARKALLGQLRAMQPPVPEADIQRESDALDAAIARLEAEREGGAPAATAPAKAEPPRAAPPAPPEPPKAPQAAPVPAPVEPKTPELGPKPAESKPADAPSVETKPAEPKAAETKPAETKPAETKPEEPRPAEAKPAEAKPANAKPAVAPADLEPADPSALQQAVAEADAKRPVAPPQPAAQPEAPKPTAAQPASPEPRAAPPASPEPTRAQLKAEAAPETPKETPREASKEAPKVDVARPAVTRPVAPSTAAPTAPASISAAPTLGPAAAPVRASSSAPPVAGPSLKAPIGAAAPELAPPSLEAVEGDAPGLTLDGEKDRPLRPLAPTPKPERTSNLRVFIIGGVLAAVVAGMGYAAWLLREKPEDLARARIQQPQQQQAAADNSGKIVERVGGGPATPPAPSQPVPTVRAPAQPIRPEPAPQQQAAQASQPAVPIAQRSALLVEAPEDPNKVKLMVGAVTWKAENGQLRAEIEVPEAKLNATMTMKKNDDLTIAASHIIEVRFTFGPDAPYAIKDLAPPEMRRDETPNGDRLSAAVVPITSDYFLVGLARGEREAANLDLIRTRGWFDLPILLQNGRVAKVTFEKGLSGERALEEAAKSW